MCSPARLPSRRFPICVSKMSEHAISIGFGTNQKASTAFVEQNGCRNRAGVVRKKKSISAAAVVRLRCSPGTPRTPIRSANFPQIGPWWMQCCATLIRRAITGAIGHIAATQKSRCCQLIHHSLALRNFGAQAASLCSPDIAAANYRGVGLSAGVGRGLGVVRGLTVGVGLIVAVGLTVAVGVPIGVAVALGVGVGLPADGVKAYTLLSAAK